MRGLAGGSGLLEQGLSADAYLPRRIDVDDFYEHLFALSELVSHILDAVVGNLRDVQESVGSGHDLDEGAKIGDALNFAQVGLIQLRRGGQLLDDRDRLLGRSAVG